MNQPLIPVIIAGGSGTRLWPLSRTHFPKQFLTLQGEQTMLQQTLTRLEGLKLGEPILLCNYEHRFIVAEQLRQLGIERAKIILEPVGRNTAPAIAIAAMAALKQHDNPQLLVLAADHLIQNVAAFHRAIGIGERLAASGELVTFGIVPTGPETGYGYIQQGQPLGEGYRVARFVEKPDHKTAKNYLQEGNYLWNSGMFLMQADTYLQQLQQYRPDIHTICQQAADHLHPQYEFLYLDSDIFSHCPAESVDYAVMERAESVAVVPLNAGWNDIGSWSALWEVDHKDSAGNSTKGDVVAHDTHNCLLHAEERLIATVGVDNLVVIETKDAVLIAQKDRAQDVKAIVDTLKQQQRSQAHHHRVVYRPWGCYDSIEEGTRFKVKRISVKPGEKLSLQMHHHRAEHWIVVSGTARVTHNDRSEIITENESIYIHVGETHSLENPGKIALELIEVQTGSYLGEDDIVRFEDRYGRQEQQP
ncbi:mannose-1-phosphate guanylyltransferase/mannose-6-phosphate isomerase [Ectothiorhodospiraceae bacterium BW-2]|nr:mannose-1-phosphate guanylyltransferase/mannose-6-phosphate isomerase [Ectothiorhodospiraceae bacterium BW-2]